MLNELGYSRVHKSQNFKNCMCISQSKRLIPGLDDNIKKKLHSFDLLFLA